MRVPVLNVHCSLCDVATVLPVRVDNRMTGDTLRDVILQQYAAFCRDEGVKFLPASSSPQDYSVYPSNESGVVFAGAAPFRSGKLSGETLRDQLTSLQSPYFAVIRISDAFLARDGVIQDEQLERNVLIEKRSKLLQSMTYMEQISCERAIELQLFRERQEGMVGRLEDMMLYAYVAYQRYNAKIDSEVEQLRQMDVVWREQCLPWIHEHMKSVETEKRVFLSASGLAVKSLLASMRGFQQCKGDYLTPLL